MLLDEGKFYGDTVKALELDHFNLTLTAYRPGEAIPGHHHENAYISLLLSGSYSEEGGKQPSILEAGHSIFRASAHEHANKFNLIGGQCFNLEIKGHTITQFDKRVHRQPVVTIKQPLLDLYHLYYLFLQRNSPDILNLAAYEVVSQLDKFQNPASHGKALWIDRVKELIGDEPDKHHSLEKMAEQANVHPVYLARKFKEKTGMRLSEYINKTRLEKVAEAILAGERNLTQVAYQCGFYDQSHLTRSFKAYFGVSPGKFRRAIKG